MKIKQTFMNKLLFKYLKTGAAHIYHVYIIIIYSVKHKHTSNESDLRD